MQLVIKMKVLALIAATIVGILIIAQAQVPPNQFPPPEECSFPCIDSVFVLDVSNSIRPEKNFELMKDLVINTSDLVNISANCSRAGLILFAGGARLEFNLNAYTDEASLRRAVNSIIYKELDFRQGTDTPAALNLMQTAAQNGTLGLSNDVDRPRIAVVITDGRPSLKYLKMNIKQKEADQRTKDAGQLLRDAKIYNLIYAVGIQGEKEEIRDTLNFIADPPELTFLIANFSQQLFNETAVNIIRQFCNPCMLKQCLRGSICKICNETRGAYCEYTCAVDNGGCDEGSQCVEVAVPTCSPGQCCSPVNSTCITCKGYECPRGSICKVCNQTGMLYCDYSCSIENGGCSQGERCTVASTCASGECCKGVVECQEECSFPCIDGVFVLDVSNSIRTEENFQLMKDFVINTFNHVNISVNCSRAGLILFAGGARIEFNLNEYTDEASLRNAVNSTKYKKLKGFRQGTDTPAALNLMRTAARAESGGNYLGLRNGVPHIAVFITDGRPNLNYLKPPKISKTEADQMTERAGRLLHDANIYDQIYAIGIQGEKGEIRDTLRFIADPPELTFLIENFSQERFDEAVANITRQFCDPCILSPCPNGSICRICRETGIRYCEFTCAVDNGGCDEGSRCIEVNVPTCSPGQCCSPVNITCQACVVGKVDCVYILDVSLSINNDSNFGLIRNLITQSAHQLTIGNDDVLFAVILFAHHAWINFTIPQYTNRMDLIDAVNNISYYDTSKLNRTGTNIPEALNLLREAGKDDRLGLRSDANYKHAIFITDGRTNTRPIEKERIGRKLTKKEKEQIDNIDIKNSIDAANELHDSGIYDDIFAIGIRGQHDVDIEELSHIASRPEFRLEIQNFTLEAFQAVIQQLSEELCNPCTELQCPNGSICRVCNHTGMPYCEYSCTIDNGGCSQGARCVEQTAECASDECCSPVVTCGTCDVGEVDFVFILDNSKSIKNDGNFGFMKKLVIQFAEVVDFGVENALFSVVTFARHAWINFPITEHITRADLIKAVNQTSYFDLPELNRTGTNMREVLDLLITAGESDGGLKLRGPEVPKIAIFITDGRPNTKDLTGNTLQEDSIETHNAAARLHESGIFNQIYAAGIKGQKDINFEELAFIASDPGLIFLIQDFNLQLFRQLQSYLITAICGRENCTVQGQIYLQEAPPPECQPTCSHPTRDCHSTAPRPGCVCPEDTVIDETQNRCVPIPQCTCPPQCSHDYCSSPLVQNSDTLIPCMRGSPPYTEASCTDDCLLTYCQACYYSRRPLHPPSGCSGYRNEPKGCLCCLREWTRCVERRNKRDNECTGDCQTITNFRCYEYPLCIIRNP